MLSPSLTFLVLNVHRFFELASRFLAHSIRFLPFLARRFRFILTRTAGLSLFFRFLFLFGGFLVLGFRFNEAWNDKRHFGFKYRNCPMTHRMNFRLKQKSRD